MINFDDKATALNAICPYFTMFPLEFPLNILARRAKRDDVVLDPFCGRGTTNFAARIVGLHSIGVDSSPVAAAITAAKLVDTTPEKIITEAKTILQNKKWPAYPHGAFWSWAYHETVLEALCRLRDALLLDCATPQRIALRGIVLGALHGPRQRTFQSYFSNQCPRTYAPKPEYAKHFWQSHKLRPRSVDVVDIIARRAARYYSRPLGVAGQVRLADSRNATALAPRPPDRRFNWVITSPPYYGMRTYIPDQWLRNWFLGGPDKVDYTNRDQLTHTSPEDFARDLRRVWRNAAAVCTRAGRLVIRFGGISDRAASPHDVISLSLRDSGWRILTIKPSGDASNGKRQADTFLRKKSKPLEECVVWARLNKSCMW